MVICYGSHRKLVQALRRKGGMEGCQCLSSLDLPNPQHGGWWSKGKKGEGDESPLSLPLCETVCSHPLSLHYDEAQFRAGLVYSHTSSGQTVYTLWMRVVAGELGSLDWHMPGAAAQLLSWCCPMGCLPVGSDGLVSQTNLKKIWIFFKKNMEFSDVEIWLKHFSL